MQFLTPLFLLAAVAVAVPIILHLTRRQQKRPVPFPSLMFLRRIPIRELRKTRLKHLFLLFLRCLGLLLLAAAFARPVISSLWLGASNPLAARSVVILLDGSMSMSRKAVWDRARAAVDEQINSLNESDQAVVIQFGESAHMLSPWRSNRVELRQVLQTAVSPSYEQTAYGEGLRLAAEQLKDAQNANHEIVMITDLQRSGLRSTLEWNLPAHTEVRIIDVGEETLNLYIDEVRIDRDVFSGVYPNPVLVRLASSPARAAEGELQLLIDNRLVERQPFKLGENGTATVTFSPFEIPDGVTRGRIVLEPDDDLPADNVYYFVVEKRRPFPVSVLAGSGRASLIYFERALSAGRNLPFVIEIIGAAEVRTLQPETSPVLLLDDVSVPPEASAISRFLESGGGVIVILGNNVSGAAYNQRWPQLLPGEILERNFVRGRDRPFTSMTDIRWEHPVFAVFRGIGRNAVVGVQFYGYWGVRPATGAGVIARFGEGAPALLEKNHGEGRLLLFTSSLGRTWSDFPLRTPYVPFWYQVVRYASQMTESPAAMKVNQVLSVEAQDPAAEVASSGSWNVIDPQGQRVISLDAEHPDFVPLRLPGYYELRRQRSTDWVAANVHAVESDLSRLQPEELEAAISAAQTASLRDLPGGVSPPEDPRQSVWWLLLLAAAGVLLIEAAIANRIVRQRSGKLT